MYLKREIVLTLIVLFIISSLAALKVYSQSISEISILVNYDPVIDAGVVEYSVKFSEYVGGGGVIIDLQLIKGDSVDIINVTRDDGAELVYEYNSEEAIITVYVNETQGFVVYYSVTGLFDEVAPNTFAGVIDLSMYNVDKLDCTIVLTGTYNVNIEPSNGVEVSYFDDETVIKLTSPLIYTIELAIEAEVPPPETTTTPTPTTTTPTETETTPTTTPTPTPTPTETPPPATETETTTPPPTETSPAPQPGINIGLLAAIVLVIVVLGLIAYMKFVRK